MESQNGNHRTIHFGVFDADLRTLELRRQGTRLKLPRQSFQILQILLERPGELVTREELQKALWPGDTFVDFDHGLNNAVKRIRAVLGDSAENPRYIETLPRMGYRFIGPINGNGNSASSQHNPVPDLAVAEAGLTLNNVGGSAFRGKRVWAITLTGLLLFAAGAVFVRWARYAHDVPALTLVPFTSFPGSEIAPTFSPDGNQIAFAWNGADNSAKYDLYVKEVGTESPVQLTHLQVNYLAPAWSPDGRYIASMRVNLNTAEMILSVMPSVGGNERQLLTMHATKSIYSLGLAWTRDSQWLAFSKAAGPEFHSHLALINVNTLEVRDIPDPSPRCEATGLAAFTQDGKLMATACMYNFGLSALFVQRFPSGPARQVQALNGDVEGLQWSNDGRSLVYSLDDNLWRTGLHGEAPERLWFGQDALMPSIAGQGKRMVYVHKQENVDIWRVSLAGNNSEPNRPFPTNLFQENPQYSPDGKKIAFESTRSGSREVWVCDIDGGHPLQLSSFGGVLTGTPRWSPDGKWIVFDSRASGRPELYVVSSGGGKPRLLPTTSTGGSVPYWSRHGSWIYFAAEVDGEYQIFKMPSEGGSPVQLTKKSGFIVKEATDGRLYYMNPRNQNAIWTVLPDGQDERSVPGLPAMAWPAWDVVSRGIYFFDAARSDNTIYFLDFSSSRSHKAVQMPGPPQPFSGQISVAPDEKSLLYARIAQRDSDLVLVEGFR